MSKHLTYNPKDLEFDINITKHNKYKLPELPRVNHSTLH
jgi:hypothetical protein